MQAQLVDVAGAEHVAWRRVDAIVNERFYILTHAGSREAVDRRLQSIPKTEAPTPPAAGIGIFSR